MREPTSAPRYIHGYLSEEQERLREQAAVIEGPIYDTLDLSGVQRLLEIGSGVGAQTEILLRRFPQLHITGLEYEPSQIAKANLNREAFGMPADQVQFVQGDAHAIPLQGGFDGAFICWVLEHVHNPLQVLKETWKQLLPGGKVWVTEVFNATFYTYPHQPAVMHYWQAYNTFQREIGGDPDVGVKLGGLLQKAGFQQITLRDDGFHLDAVCPKSANRCCVIGKI
ncbi:methyltransferase [Nitritalea halalkaliphila LW7]|uniref:Methyltransferase n=1 Tax=Nitritalea halalkaliphila LW7 TaxID=1189621 RepID=I5BVU0_9BACT|nr:class I SAM-dependent methyltransferase [Nitritalea halalkaliphila]EIM73692.1 methyltransferase [Nitritalea halalkaliphila LW7]